MIDTCSDIITMLRGTILCDREMNEDGETMLGVTEILYLNVHDKCVLPGTFYHNMLCS